MYSTYFVLIRIFHIISDALLFTEWLPKYIFYKALSSRLDSRKPSGIPFTQLDSFKCIECSAGHFHSLTATTISITIISTIISIIIIRGHSPTSALK